VLTGFIKHSEQMSRTSMRQVKDSSVEVIAIEPQIRQQAKAMAVHLRSLFIDQGCSIPQVYSVWSSTIVNFFFGLRGEDELTYQALAVATWHELLESCQTDPKLRAWATGNFQDLFKLINLTTLCYERNLQPQEISTLLNETLPELILGEANYEIVEYLIESTVSKVISGEFAGEYKRSPYEVANNLLTVYLALSWTLPAMSKLAWHRLDDAFGDKLMELYRRLFSPEIKEHILSYALNKYRGYEKVISMCAAVSVE
jgi:hypothetical protein